MSALVYILYRSFVNTVKSFAKKPAVVIAYVVFACLLLLPAMLHRSEQAEPAVQVSMDAAKAVFMGYVVFLFVLILVSSLGGASFFRMADVNLLFTAPINPGYILIYGFVKQLAVNLGVMVFLALQYPNWKRTFGFIDGAGWILMFSYILLITVTPLLGMILYSNVAGKPERTRMVQRLIYGFCIAFVLPIAFNLYRTGDILNSVVGWLSNDYLKFIPLVGWFREMFAGVFTGITPEVLLYIIFTLGVVFVLLVSLYRTDPNYYEHVLTATERKEDMMRSMREGKSSALNVPRKFRKVKGSFNVEGSLAVFERQILEKKRKGYWLISGKTIILVICGIIAAMAVPANTMELVLGIYAVSVYVMLIFAMVGVWESCLSSHHIYMIPVPPMSKMFAVTLPDLISNTIEGALLFGIVGVMLRVPLGTIVSIIVAYATMSAVLTYSELVGRRLFGKVYGVVLRIFLRIVLLMIIVLFVVVPTAVVITSTGSYLLGFGTISLVNIVLVLLFMWIGVGLFVSPELA